MTTREEVIRVAREWINTPFVWGCRTKGKGADCTFVATVYEEAGVLKNIPLPEYPRGAHLNCGNYYESVLDKIGARITAEPKPGDLALFEGPAGGRTHSAIVVDWPTVIHAFMVPMRGKVCMMTDKLIPHKGVTFYTFW